MSIYIDNPSSFIHFLINRYFSLYLDQLNIRSNKSPYTSINKPDKNIEIEDMVLELDDVKINEFMKDLENLEFLEDIKGLEDFKIEDH